MAARWTLIAYLLLWAFVHFGDAQSNHFHEDFDEEGALADPFVYAASNSVDWSSRISPSTTPGPGSVQPPKKRTPASSYYSSATAPDTTVPKRPRRKKVTTTTPPSYGNDESYNTEPFPNTPYNRASSFSSPPFTFTSPTTGNKPRQSASAQAPNPYPSTTRSYSQTQSQRSRSAAERRKPVFEQPGYGSSSTSPASSSKPKYKNRGSTNYSPPSTEFIRPSTDYIRPQNFGPSTVQQGSQLPQYSTAFPTPQAPRKRIVVVKKSKPRQDNNGQSSPQSFNYSPRTAEPSVEALIRNSPAGSVLTPQPREVTGRPLYQDEVRHGFTDIRDQILQANDEVQSGSKETPQNFFEPPKIQIPTAATNEKGCKMVIKEVQEMPHDLHARGSDMLESFFRTKRSPDEKRRVKSIIMTKECYYPDGSAPNNAQAPHIDPKFFEFGSSVPSHQGQSNTNHRNYPSSSQGRPKYNAPTQRYDSGPNYYDYSSEEAKESSYEPRERQNYNPQPQPQARQSSNRQQQSRQSTHTQPEAPRKQQKNQHSTSSEPSYDGYDDRGSDYRDGSPSQSNFERDVFGPDFGGFSFESGFGGGHQPSSSRQTSSGGGGDRQEASHRPAASQSGHRSKPTPKMFQKTFEFYKKDNGKDNDPNNNSNAEEFATGYFKHYSTDYDSDRDGPKKKGN